jgi:hypothetical protein
LSLTSEADELPLLSVFRFVRFTRFYVAEPRNDVRLIRETSNVYLCGQVLSYASVGTLTERDGLIIEPGSRYVCHVSIRHSSTSSDPPRVVAIPLNEVRQQAISREQFVIGFCHGMAATSPVPEFATPWASVLEAPVRSNVDIRRRILRAFDCTRESIVLPDDQIILITPGGERTVVHPCDYICSDVFPPTYPDGIDIVTEDDDQPQPNWPLLETSETVLSDADQVLAWLASAAALPVPIPTPPVVRSRSRSPVRQFRDGRSRSRSRSNQRDRATDRHANQRNRPPHEVRSSGMDRFQPTKTQTLVHRLVRVGPRVAERTESTDALFRQFMNYDTQDRVTNMLQTERFRGQYHASKTTTKMLYAVDFFTRPLDHFLPPTDPARHDDTQRWGEEEQLPPNTISRPDQLHSVLHAIVSATTEWYPNDIAQVFRTVLNQATRQVRSHTTQPVLHAFIKLYTAVFKNLYENITEQVPLRELEGHAIRMLRDDSHAYRSLVTEVLHDAMINRIFTGPIGAPRFGM